MTCSRVAYPINREHTVTFLYALWIVPILGLLIFLHELGHFVMARRAGVRVEEFGFGLPPRIWGVKRGDTIYSINLLPIGGFVRVHGEDGRSFANDSMQTKTAWQRTKFLAAGSIMNFITAFIVLALIVSFQGESRDNVYVVDVQADSPAAAAGWQSGDRFVSFAGESIDDPGLVQELTAEQAGEVTEVVLERNGELIETTVTPRENPPAGEGRNGITMNRAPLAVVEVEDVPAGTLAEEIGLQEGDELRSLDGEPITDYLAYRLYLENNTGKEVTLEIERDGELVTIPFQVPAEIGDGGPLGASFVQNVDFERVPVTEIPGKTVSTFFDTIGRMADGLVSLITGETPLDELAGPIGMGQLTSEVISESALPLWVTLANLTFILSLNLGFLNLLPLPALDGGRLLFVLIEVLRGGRRVSPEKEGVVHFVGLVVLLTVMLGIAFVDVDRIISGGSFLEMIVIR